VPNRSIFGIPAPILLAALSALAGPATLAVPPGTQIINVASVQFTTSALPAPPPLIVQSNPAVIVVSAAATLTASKSSQPAGTVAPGTAVTFRILVENSSGLAITNARITDPLDPFLGAPTFIATGSVPNQAPPGGAVPLTGSFDSLAREVIWDVPLVPAGARFELRFVAGIDPATPDDSTLLNATTQTSAQDPAGTSSNTVSLSVVSPALSISKLASRSRAEVGDPIGYTVEIANIAAALDLTNVEVSDKLPRGFLFQEGSARLDGRPIPDPIGSGRAVRFALGGLAAGAGARLSYVAVPGPDAERSDAVNEALVSARTPGGALVSAGPARAAVRVSGSLLSAEPVILGRVFVDDNHNGIVDEGEPGVPGARLFLEDGSWAVSDVLGKYHIEGSRPGIHVLKVDETTIPRDLAPFAHASRSAGNGATQFVDVGAGQVWKGNVAVAGWGSAVSRLQAHGVFRKRERGASERFEDRRITFPPVLASALFEPESSEVASAGRGVIDDYAALIRERGSGLVELEVAVTCHALADADLMNARAGRLHAELRRLVMASTERPEIDGEPREPVAIAAVEPAVPQAAPGAAPAASGSGSAELAALAERVKQMDETPFILSPDESAAVDTDRAAVEVKLPAGLTPRLRVNDEEISRDQIAVKMETSISRVAFYRYLGVPFKAGRNAVVLEGVDSFGNRRAWVERTILRTGPPASIALRPGDDPLQADGRTPFELRADVRDAEGLPVSDGTIVTLQLTDGEFLGVDADPHEEGFQARTRDGVVVAHLAPVAEKISPTVTATAAGAQADLTLVPSAVARDWIVAGIGEASVGQAQPSGATSVQDLLDESSGASGRMALFARGRLFEDALLSVAYDSGRREDPDALFRKIAPDRFFPIYGDTSQQGYEVETQGKLALKLEHPQGMLAVGDFATALPGGDLLRYDRALSGGVGRLDLGRFNAQTFAASTQQTQARDDIPGAGTSGPYRLSSRPVVINSERVTLETRDRYRPERIVSSVPLARYADYDIDTTNGILLFKRPVPFHDDDLQPVFIVVLYEVVGGSGERTVAGGRMGYRIAEGAEVGGTYVHEGRTGGALSLAGADFRLRRSFAALSGGSVEMSAEAAATESAGGDPASAVSWRAGAQIGGRVTLSGYYRNVAEGFDNTSRGGLSDVGTIRWGLAGGVRLDESSRVAADFFQQEDSVNDQHRRVAALDWEKDLTRVTARAGIKDVRADSALTGQQASSRLALAGMGLRLSRRWEGLVAHQQVVSGEAMPEYPTRSTAGFTFHVTDQVRAFMRYEIDSADVGRSSRSVVGMESQLGKSTVIESRYSLEDALLGERGLAQVGLRTKLPLSADWLGDASLERVQSVQGGAGGDFTALATGFEYLPSRIKLGLRYEARFGETEDLHTITAAGATRLTDDLSLFTRQRLFFVAPDVADQRLDGDGLLGLAFRPVDSDRLNYLFKIQALKGEGALGAGSPSARSLLAVLEASHQPAARFHLLGRVGWRRSSDLLDGSEYAATAWLGEGRFLYDITERVNAGVNFRLMEQPGVNSTLMGWGVESGVRVATDLWLVGGFNVTGISTSGFADSERREAGPFFTMRFKFDESTLLGLARALPRVEPAR